ncbi:MAG: hypothetical protein HC871_09320, partial [Rhizobiales bacterium]|nr:hypothetical protein [Hyphomicrobiales bacterium]
MKILNILLPTIAVAFLAFLAGSYVMFAEAGPAGFLNNAYKAGHALLDQQTNYRHPYFSRFYQKARTDQRGVTIYEPSKTEEGFTLYSSGHEQRVHMISMNGDLVHAWQVPFSSVWNDQAAVKNPVADSHIYNRAMHLYPNGDLLAMYIASGDTPWGYGLVKMTKDSEVIWTYLEQTHHDLDVGPDGRIYTLTHEIRNDVIEAWTQLVPPRIDDYVVVLSPDGEELEKVDVTRALIDSPYGRMLTRIPWYAESSGDYLHTNAIDVITRENAAVFPVRQGGATCWSPCASCDRAI